VNIILLCNAANNESQQTENKNEIEPQRTKIKAGETYQCST